MPKLAGVDFGLFEWSPIICPECDGVTVAAYFVRTLLYRSPGMSSWLLTCLTTPFIPISDSPKSLYGQGDTFSHIIPVKNQSDCNMNIIIEVYKCTYTSLFVVS